jgi:hypothetical protein
MNAQTTGRAVEYLRRSVERDKGADKDRGAGQRAANAAQAARDGVTIVRTFDGDWGTSGGRGKREKRAAMAELIDAIRVGDVSRVYCHTTDRLARDVEYGMALWNACKDAGTILRPGSQSFDPREPGYLTLWTVLLAQAEEDLDRMTRKNVDVSAWRAEHIATCGLPGRPHMGRCHIVGCADTRHCRYSHRRGHGNYGERPGEDANAVIAAYQDAGSILAAARLLNVRGVPTRMGGPWSSVSVRQLLVRLGAYPNRTRPGAKARAPFVFYGLLRCHCRHLLTGSRYQNGPDPGYTSYKCHMARTVPDHGPGSIPEKRMLEWAKAEVAARLHAPAEIEMEAVNREAERSALAARRTVIEDMYESNGPTWRDEYRRRIGAVAKAEERLRDQEVAAVVVPVPEVAWDRPAEKVNEVLRALWYEVTMDATMAPIEAIPIVPEWWA